MIMPNRQPHFGRSNKTQSGMRKRSEDLKIIPHDSNLWRRESSSLQGHHPPTTRSIYVNTREPDMSYEFFSVIHAF